MYRDGFSDITSCDYSSVVITKMKEKCVEKTGMKCSWMVSWTHFIGDVMDVHHMTYADESFDVVLDKGTLDAIICGDESSSNPEEALSEINRVLKKNGVYICISYGMPEYRLDYFQSASLKWKVVHISLRRVHSLFLFFSKIVFRYTIFSDGHRVLPSHLRMSQTRMGCLLQTVDIVQQEVRSGVVTKRLKISTSAHIDEDSKIPSDCILHASFSELKQMWD